MRTAFAAVVSLLIIMSAASAADPIGRYWSYWAANPKSTGQSTVVVRQTGNTYHIDWGDNADTGAGFGILNKDLLAVTHTEKDWSGFFLGRGPTLLPRLNRTVQDVSNDLRRLRALGEVRMLAPFL